MLLLIILFHNSEDVEVNYLYSINSELKENLIT